MKNAELYKEMARGLRRGYEQEKERLTEKARQLEERMNLIDALDGMLTENRRQLEDIESLQQQLAEEKKQRAELEMKLAELNKLTAGVAKKASEEVLLKTIQTYVNKSKQKRPEKRAAAKEWALEMVLANKLNVPEDLAEAIDHLDDELSEPKTVTVNGNYFEAHDNGEVKVKG